MNQSSSEFLDLFRSRGWKDVRVESDHHSHPIVPWAREEFCVFCRYPASHKVADADGNPQLHPLTAYVCCDHFWSSCNNTKVIMKTMDEPHTRGAETLDEVPQRIRDRYRLEETEEEALAEDSNWRYKNWDYDG